MPKKNPLNESEHRMQVVDASVAGAKLAKLSFRVVGMRGSATQLEVRLLTGRKHQIRVQLSSRGWPVVGDKKYGAPTRFTKGIALHAREIEFVHPVKKTNVRILAPPPEYWIRRQ